MLPPSALLARQLTLTLLSVSLEANQALCYVSDQAKPIMRKAYSGRKQPDNFDEDLKGKAWRGNYR